MALCQRREGVHIYAYPVQARKYLYTMREQTQCCCCRRCSAVVRALPERDTLQFRIRWSGIHFFCERLSFAGSLKFRTRLAQSPWRSIDSPFHRTLTLTRSMSSSYLRLSPESHSSAERLDRQGSSLPIVDYLAAIWGQASQPFHATGAR